MTGWLGGAVALLMAAAAPALAQTSNANGKPRSVIELFTSQGCSSCPAADALFVELARDPSLIVLTFPVDYWDYLGWKDTLAHSAFSQRQRGYAKARSDGQVYTPQAIIDGVAHAVGSDKQAMMQIVATHQSTPLPLDVRVEDNGSQIRIVLSGSANSGSVWILPVARMRSVAIHRGENKGRDVTYANVVRGMMRIGDWRGEAMSLDVPSSLVRQPDADTYVVLVHSDTGKVGRVIGAARAPRF
jgi:hypothetical protein